MVNDVLYYKYPRKLKTTKNDIVNDFISSNTQENFNTNVNKNKNKKEDSDDENLYTWKKIPYEYETVSICTNIHLNLRHACLTK